MSKIRIGILGYGNIGKGAELAVAGNADMELVAVFTRREPDGVKILTEGVPVLHIDEAKNMTDKIDVMLLCGGSATDLPEQGPMFASMFNTVDTFDTHAKIPEYFDKMNAAAGSTSAIISVGWDPGLFSMMRLLGGEILPAGESYTFWGNGVSQGHSDAVRRIEGVKNAVQYTIPVDSAVEAVRAGKSPEFTARQKHIRECYVVALPDADTQRIENEIKSMPNYFSDYDTIVHFVTEDELKKNHSGMPHGGFVFRSGNTGANKQMMEFSIKLDSNPEFTGSIMAAYARAAFRMAKEKNFGAKTVFDIPLSYLSAKDGAALRVELL